MFSFKQKLKYHPYYFMSNRCKLLNLLSQKSPNYRWKNFSSVNFCEPTGELSFNNVNHSTVQTTIRGFPIVIFHWPNFSKSLRFCVKKFWKSFHFFFLRRWLIFLLVSIILENIQACGSMLSHLICFISWLSVLRALNNCSVFTLPIWLTWAVCRCLKCIAPPPKAYTMPWLY
jgi:hypothetical protein